MSTPPVLEAACRSLVSIHIFANWRKTLPHSIVSGLGADGWPNTAPYSLFRAIDLIKYESGDEEKKTEDQCLDFYKHSI